MVCVNIGGIDIDFPFEPYECQRKYMEKVIVCLQKGFNGVLESPTGTGKTLCLLCATLAWRETYAARLQLERVGTIGNAELKEELGSMLSKAAGSLNAEGSWQRGFADIPKIIYASRTHSQISQAVSELKNTRYTPKICVLGSRDQMCINSEVMKEENNNGKVHLCRMKVANKQCFYYNNLEASKATLPNEILDIEDLVSHGREKKFCPYYMARELRKEADLIFMPYNYVLDFKARNAHGIDLTNTIILLDEAHNVESVCEANASFDLTSFDLASCIEDCQQCIEILMQYEEDNTLLDEASIGDLTPEDATLMKTLFLKLEEFIIGVELKNNCATKSASFLFDELSRLNVNQSSKDQILETIEKMSGIMTAAKSKAFQGKNYALDKFAGVLKTMFARSNTESGSSTSNDFTTRKFYKVHIQAEKKDHTSKQKRLDVWSKSRVSSDDARTLSYWCFNPGLTMSDLLEQGVRSLILTSGTLAPLPSFKFELQVPFNVELENDHVIEEHQVFVGIVPQGPDGKRLNSSYQFRSTAEYQLSLGNTVVNLSRIIPHGLLVFFPSYPVMDMVIAKWQDCGIWNRLGQNKGLFIEPRRKQGLTETMNEFYERIHDPTLKGAIFFAVCRGKVSEGLDFADANGRAVVITGLPFPPSHDAKVVLKMQYLDEQKNSLCIKGKDWYRQQASRAVNQAIGRVIRHKNDFGAILLCDERFRYSDAKAHLPVWIKRKIREFRDFGHAQRELVSFFRDINQKMGIVESLAKQKRKLDDVICNEDPTNEKKTKHVKTSTLSKRLSKVFSGSSIPSVVNADQGKASSSLAKLLNCSNKKPSIFESLNPLESTTVHQTVSSNLIEGQHSTLSSSILANAKCAIADDITSSSTLKTKKYKIVTNSSKKSSDKTSSGKAELGKANTDKVQDARQYISKVKSILSSERYEKFGHALKLYKQSGNIKLLMEHLKEIFDRNNLEHVSLLEGFSCFVRKENDKKYFEETCEKFSGTDCMMCKKEAFKPHHLSCQHAACFTCFCKLKKEKSLKCPKCQLSFRWKDLRKSYIDGQLGLYGFDFSDIKI